ncbi:hypothetical protein WN944_000460 [Citrus x changshan-huyou]|uniref:Uncharacterized protein n=1 Tax=Citrus x changshan-huyou TaxID=2935761 RepID=A0AAP0QQB5_9ROSI
MQSSYLKLQVNCSLQKPSISHNFDHFKSRLSSAFKMFEFVDQPLLQSQRNFAPVDELREAVLVTNIEGEIPEDFPEGPNPLFGGLKSTKSMFGKSNHIGVEGEGMLHALYFKKETDGSWNLRFGKINKYISNTNIFEHAGKFYSVAENHMPQEIDIFTLETLGNWDVNGAWNRPFTSHPKKAPGTGELVIMGVDATKPFVEIGVISADGHKLAHKVDLKLSRCSLCHEIGVTQRYNVFLDYPLSIDLTRLAFGGPLIKYELYAKIGIMPRYGDADSVKWFDVEPNCTFHIINCFEDGDEV